MAGSVETGEDEKVRSNLLSNEHSFILCDTRVSGFPIRHASEGFKDMFLYAEGESPARSEKLDGCSSIMDSEAAVVSAARAAGVVKALQLLEDIAAEISQKATGGERAGKASSVLLVKAKRGGEMFVCLLTVALHRHPATGWSFLVGLHEDLTRTLSVHDVLQAAALGPRSVETLLAGLHKQTQCQESLLEHPTSVTHLNEAFHKVWGDFLSGLVQGSKLHRGGRGGDKGSGSAGNGGKHGKSKMARSEVSAATTASNVSVRKRSSGDGTTARVATSTPTQTEAKTGTEAVPTSYDSCAADFPESPLAAHLLELLEPLDVEPQFPAASIRAAGARQMVDGCQSGCSNELPMTDISDLVSKKELRELDFPLAIFDPSQPGLPAILCSAGLASRSDFPVSEGGGKMEGIALNEMIQRLDEAEECGAMCEAAMRGEYYSSSPCAAGLAKFGVGRGQRLAEGELVCAEASTTRSGEAQESMVYLKQVELDEKMYIVCLQAEIPDDEEAFAKLSEADLLFAGEGASGQTEDRRWLAYMCLDGRMDALLQAFAAHFWFSAPMRRQTAVAEEIQSCAMWSS
eukprot:CAMPEP_0171267602 /NCGR_PEP_ID=MMETSP0790-20130122/59242_1 /TAXON_ID=2925 /ORGANISM="Alexandrium catenella, Strain OF101" /LENGTH=573 /DNA_ID=CAMNT_0011736341 /DNA_START=28 /DNA_END=1749 /DNA_ORIENTATION=+